MKSGLIEVISGCMFSGKSEELVRRLRRATIGRKKVIAFKPHIDNRYHPSKIGSHIGTLFEAIPISNSQQIPGFLDGHEVVGIDEVQFLDEGIVDLCETLANRGVRVIAAGLDLDSDNKPFGAILPTLMCLAERVTKLDAVCVVCGDEPATRSFYKGKKMTQVAVGADEYEARCRGCHQLPAE